MRSGHFYNAVKRLESNKKLLKYNGWIFIQPLLTDIYNNNRNQKFNYNL